MEKLISLDPNDVIVVYMVNKDISTGIKPKGNVVTQIIYDHVHTHAVYFNYGPKFVNGVLLFGIVGTPSDQEKLQEGVKNDLLAQGCKLKIVHQGNRNEFVIAHQD